jgi:hypothetical protein
MPEGAREEVAEMEFTITCPIDGPITVSLEDIDTVVLREAERADITFVCPHCGTEITVTAVVPSFLMAAIEALAEDGDTTGGTFSGLESRFDSRAIDAAGGASPDREHEALADSYCEYFRRQLARIECVDDVLAEIDSTR